MATQEAKAAAVATTQRQIKEATETIGNDADDDFSDLLLDVDNFGDNNLDIPNSQWFKGQYMPVNRQADSNMRDFMDIMGASNEQLGIAGNAQRQVPIDMIVKFAQSRRDMSERRNELNLAALLVDPKDPRTTERAFALYPELRSVPEQRMIRMAKLSMMIEQILRSGVVSSRKENVLVYQLLDPRSKIPSEYPWVELVKSAGDKKTSGQEGYLYWQMNPFNHLDRGQFRPAAGVVPGTYNHDYGADVVRTAAGVEMSGIQFKLKAILLRRLYPALYRADDAAILQVLSALFPAQNTTLAEFTHNFRHTINRRNGSYDQVGNPYAPVVGDQYVGPGVWDQNRFR